MNIKIKPHIFHILFAFCILFLIQSGNAQSIYKIDSQQDDLTIQPNNILVFTDSTNLLTALQVADSANLLHFANAVKMKPSPQNNYWLLCRFENHTNRDQKWLLDAGRYYVKEMYDWDSLQLGNSNFTTNGRAIPYSKKDIRGFTNYALPLKMKIARGEIKTVLLKVYSPTDFYLPNQFVIRISNIERFMTSRYFSNVVGAFLVGGITLISLYHLCLFFFLRERMYLSFVGVTGSTALFFAYYHGFSIEFLWPNHPIWDIYSFIFILTAYALFLLRFAQLYMSVKMFPPFWRYMITGLQMAIIFPALMVIPDFFTESPHPYLLTLATKAQTVLLLIIEIFILVLSLVGIIKKVNSAISFFLANMPPLIGGVALSLVFLGLLTPNDIIILAPQIGILLMSIMFSYGLGKKIVSMKAEISNQQLETERIEREKELETQRIIEQKNQELEKKVIERTSQIVQQKEEITMQKQSIELQNTQLHLLNEEKNNLINIVAHDLKSPLNQINGLMFILKSSILDIDKSQVEIIDMVADSSHRLSSMITNLLDINAIESGNLKIDKQLINLSESCQQLLAQFQEIAYRKNIKLQFDIEENLEIKTDNTLIYQCFENLLSNAIKFSPHGKEVHVKLESYNNKARLSVKDQGPGISTDDMKKLFGKFQKLSAQPTGGEHSTGLGLSIVKRYVEIMNGKVWCDSQLNQGATFYIEI